MLILRKLRKAAYSLIMFFKSSKKTSSPIDNSTPLVSIFDISLNNINGLPVSLSNFKGQKMLIVNVASECGYTPQYNELQKLYERYSDKLVVLGFPSNDFGAQEPGTNAAIKFFCEERYHVSFPMFEKSHVVGEKKNALYRWLTNAAQNGWNSQVPEWNFYKYLIDCYLHM